VAGAWAKLQAVPRRYRYWVPIPVRSWARRASDRQLRRLEKRLNAMPGKRGLVLWLRLCHGSERPELIGKDQLAKLAQNRDEDIALWSRRCLTIAPDHTIRELAADLLARGDCHPELLRILLAFKRPAPDMKLIEAALNHKPGPADPHGMVLSLVSGLRGIRNATAARLLMWCYEHSPCAFCRHTVVLNMVRRRIAPVWLLRECLNDSYPQTRERARKALRRRIRHPKGSR